MSTTPLASDHLLQPAASLTPRALLAPVAVDAAVSALFGLGLVVGGPALSELTGMGVGWLRGIGAFAVVYAGELTFLSFRLRATTTRRHPAGRVGSDARLVRMVGVGNLGWVAASVVVATAVDLTATGLGVVAVQALLVLGIAVWQLLVGRSDAAGR